MGFTILIIKKVLQSARQQEQCDKTEISHICKGFPFISPILYFHTNNMRNTRHVASAAPAQFPA